ncbi:MAG: ribonuclease H-like domain-containing protein [Dehalococcoidales bacterium]|nr:ribonuclease H-like domain-containing protein [Dehalococcoidales bacterium]
MPPELEAYLDIETTGLYPVQNEITVVGIYITDNTNEQFIQFVGKNITGKSILETLQGVTSLYTYNGRRFDLPFIHARHGINLESYFKHCDLMHHCWRNNLYGGLKAVERCLGIERRLKEVNGYEAIKLWWRYIQYSDRIALQKLLDYNKEDVINLKILKDRLIPRPEIS